MAFASIGATKLGVMLDWSISIYGTGITIFYIPIRNIYWSFCCTSIILDSLHYIYDHPFCYRVVTLQSKVVSLRLTKRPLSNASALPTASKNVWQVVALDTG